MADCKGSMATGSPGQPSVINFGEKLGLGVKLRVQRGDPPTVIWPEVFRL